MTDKMLPTQTFPPKSKDLENLLSAGYGGMTVEMANRIIKEREANPAVWPYEEYAKATAFLAAWNSKPKVISKRPGWKRLRSAY